MKKLMISMMMVMFLTGCVGNAILPDEPQNPDYGSEFGVDIIGIGINVGANHSNYMAKIRFENSKLELQGESK